MTIPTIFETSRPRDDVLRGVIAEADFAADLAQVVAGRGGAEYLDPARFFARTYPTRGLKDLLANVGRRLTGAGGEAAAIFRLDTSYGGGKTHGLIALVHAARGMRGVANVAEFVEPALIPAGPVRIAAFDGENADPANGRAMGEGVLAHTPWGEIAHALAGRAGYERVRASDERRVAPGAGTLRELFGGEPALILLDELSVYLRKVRRFDDAHDQLTAFLTSLFKAVEGRRTRHWSTPSRSARTGGPPMRTARRTSSSPTGWRRRRACRRARRRCSTRPRRTRRSRSCAGACSRRSTSRRPGPWWTPTGACGRRTGNRSPPRPPVPRPRRRSSRAIPCIPRCWRP